MANTTVDRNKLIERASEAFRRRGFEGTSLSDLVAATGLQRASLYHHFPGGKTEIASQVLKSVDQQFAAYILEPLSTTAPAKTQVVEMGKRLAEFYQNGEKSCLLNAFSFDECAGALGEQVNNSFVALLDAFAALAAESGFSEAEARERAEDAMIKLQGALVFARASKNNRPFARVIAELPKLLIK